MSKTHYEVLGLTPKSTSDQIRTAYRKIALQHHPDRSDDPASLQIFMAATEAYEVLGDAERKRSYDEVLRMQRLKEEQVRLRQIADQKQAAGRPKPQNRPSQPSPSRTPQTKTNIQPPASQRASTAPSAASYQSGGGRGATTLDVTRLTILFSRGQVLEAEKLARKILADDPRQPIPYAVLGDMYRQRGDLSDASKMYAFAVQMDPNNTLYMQRHEELLGAVSNDTADGPVSPAAGMAPFIAVAVVVLAAVYIALSREQPVAPGISFISTWTLGLLSMLFLSGLFIGATLSVARLLDRFSTLVSNALGKPNPSIALAFVAVLNFWVAAALYGVLALTQRSANYSTTRLVAAVAAAVAAISLAATLSDIGPGQVFLWGGNVVYLGSLCGWMVADSLQRASP